MAGFFAFAQIAISVMLVVNWWRAATGRLQRNLFLGVRTPATMRSEQSWVAGNRAALRLAPLYVLTTAPTCVALFAVALYGWRTIVVLLGIGGFAAVIVLSVYTAVIASRAANAADGQPDDRRGPRGASGPSFEEGATMGAFSDRVMTIIGWIVAVAAWFRDSTTRSW